MRMTMDIGHASCEGGHRKHPDWSTKVDCTVHCARAVYTCVGARVMKNWDPLVFGPELAMDRTPAPVCFSPGWISSANVSP